MSTWKVEGNGLWKKAAVVVLIVMLMAMLLEGMSMKRASAATGSVTREYWLGASGLNVSDIPLHLAPGGTDTLTSLEGPVDWGNNYGARIRGYIHAPSSGNYTFYASGDDHVQFWLSTSANPADKQLVLHHTGWTYSREWNKYPAQQSASISLTGGSKYYFEVLHKEADGGDNVAIGWTGPGISSVTVIPGSQLSPYTPGGPNLLQNAGFEDGINHWSAWAGTFQSASGQAKAGSYGLQSASGGGGQSLSLQPNTTYRLGAWGKSDNAGEMIVGLKVTPTGGSTYDLATLSYTESSYTYKEVEFTTPGNISTNSYESIVFVWKNSSGNSYADDIYLGLANGGGGATGSYHVEGSTIIDPDGNPYVMKGVNVSGPRWPWARDTIQDAGLIADVWQFNTVRVNMFPRMAQHGISHNLDLAGIVQAFSNKGMVVILENHDIYGTYPEANAYYAPNGDRIPSLSEVSSFWVDIANTYKNNSNVWFNIANEPGLGGLSNEGSKTRWRTFHEDIVQAIRDTGANNIIVLDEHNWGQANALANGLGDSAVLAQGQYFTSNYSNIVFALHMYGDWAHGEGRLQQYVDDAQSKGLSVHIGEYGASDNASIAATAAMFNVTVPEGIGRIAWHWVGEDAYDLTTSSPGGGWQINQTNGSKPSNLSWMGNLIWEDNRGNLSTPITAPVPIMINSGFEEDMNGWDNWSGASIVNSGAQSGSKAIRIASGATGGAGQRILLKSNTTYKLSAWGRHNPGNGTSTFVGVEYVSNGVQSSHMISFEWETSWTYKEVTFTTPNVLASPLLLIWKANADSEAFLDNIGVVQQ